MHYGLTHPLPSGKGMCMKKQRVNVRRPDVMNQVANQVIEHYRSEWVDAIRSRGGELTVGNTRVVLAREFGFCYGVQRAIDLAYAARKVFPENTIYLIGEIIHNPEVNRQLTGMGVRRLPWGRLTEEYEALTGDDVVIVPAFGAPMEFMDKLMEKGVSIVDTTCGDVMKVWKRVRSYADMGVTSIIHGKATHEETMATSSRAVVGGKGKFLIVLTLDDCEYVCDYIKGKGDKAEFLQKFEGACSPGFDPDRDLQKVGIANQTTMLKSETESIQNKIKKAMIERDGNDEGLVIFDTICGATQDRQNSLFEMLKSPPDMLLVVGGYNSSNTTHLVEIAEKMIPTFFISSSECLRSVEEIIHFDLRSKETITSSYAGLMDPEKFLTVGITAGASCPGNLIEEALTRVFELRGISKEELARILGVEGKK